MKIERLELYGYKRLMLSNIQRFVYTPEAPQQLILGTNGSGKSSILFELSPLPAQAANYAKDGFKDITISHRGAQYRLVSAFKSGNKHSFLKDNEELNPGGTGQVQKELVRREFGLTPELHEILIGDLKFTDMPPMRRRDWITALSSADFSYALGVFNKLRTAARDHQGAVRHLKQRLTQETNNLKTLVELEGLEEKSQQLRDELTLLLSSRTPGVDHFDALSTELDGYLVQIRKLARATVQQIVPVPAGKSFKSVQDVQTDLQAIENEVSLTQSLLERATKEYSDLEAMLASITGSGEVEIDNLDELLETEQVAVEELHASLELFKELEDGDVLLRDTDKVLPDLITLFAHLPDNTDRHFSRERVAAAQDAIREARKVVDKSSARLAQIHARLTLINSAKDTQCPKCLYVWREGYSENEVRQNEQWQSEHNAIIDQAQRAIAEHEAYLEAAQNYTALYNQFRGFVNGYPRMKALWDYLLENHCVTNRPETQTDVFYIWRRDVERTAQIEASKRKLKQLHELSDKQHQLGGSRHFHLRLQQLHHEIEETTGKLQDLRATVKDRRSYMSHVVQVDALAQELNQLLQRFQQCQSDLIVSLRNREIDRVVTAHQNELGVIQHQLNERRTLEGIVRDLSADLDRVELDYQATSLLAQALSPTEGLIAEQLRGSIQCLVDQINSIIASVWTYDLAVLPCGMESEELDYKFPLQVRSVDNIVSDISKGSTAQREIVNFAFVLTVMLYLGLSDYPLYLDELGAGFDEQHRTNVMGFVKQLIDTNHHSQLFMVSHYAANHGSFVSAQVLVLDGSNIAVPGSFNQHVQMG